MNPSNGKETRGSRSRSPVSFKGRWIWGIPLVTLLLFFLLWSTPESERPLLNQGMDHRPMHGFIGSPSCMTCHLEEGSAWQGSHHERAMARVDEHSVRGEFDGTRIAAGDEMFTLYRETDGRYYVQIERGETRVEQQVTHTFGWEPLQQYMVEREGGRYQLLPVAWDTENEQWFALQTTSPEEDRWLHWEGGGMTWNSMCADCHSTRLEPEFDPDDGTFSTTFAEIHVGCEACHGPGEEHAARMQLGEVVGGDPDYSTGHTPWEPGESIARVEVEVNQCAACHSVRQPLTLFHSHEGEFLDHFDPMLPLPTLYTEDGQILEEVFEWGSYLQSRMAHEGVTCSDCHNPHSLELRAPITTNQLCLQCHTPDYNEPEHHHHPIQTEASQCISCHMPERIYMGVDGRRDHSFRVPRPDLSLAYGVPNACMDCHTEQSDQWAVDAINHWYGPNRTPEPRDSYLRATRPEELRLDPHESQSLYDELSSMAMDGSRSGVVRSLALHHAIRIPESDLSELLEQALFSDHALLRRTAAGLLGSAREDVRRPLLSRALSDSVRAVRIVALDGLLGTSWQSISPIYRSDVDTVMQEYEQFLDRTAPFSQGRMNRARLQEHRQEWGGARDSYEALLEEDPLFHPARINLAILLHQRGEIERATHHLETALERDPDLGEAHYAMALLLAEQGEWQRLRSHIDRAAVLMPNESRVHYNRAIAHQQLGSPREAELSYLRSIELEPSQPEYLSGLLSLYLQQERTTEALEVAKNIQRWLPERGDIGRLINELETTSE